MNKATAKSTEANHKKAAVSVHGLADPFVKLIKYSAMYMEVQDACERLLRRDKC